MPPPLKKVEAAAYNVRTASGKIYGELSPRDSDRLKQTLEFVPSDAKSLLDCGCDQGQWLSFVLQHRRLQSHLGVDVSPERVAEASRLHPELQLRCDHLEDLNLEPRSFDVVTALEVLEHVPEWQAVLDKLLEIAHRRVIVTVPYQENIIQTVCIHCGKLTPLYGHLHVFTENSFPSARGGV